MDPRLNEIPVDDTFYKRTEMGKLLIITFNNPNKVCFFLNALIKTRTTQFKNEIFFILKSYNKILKVKNLCVGEVILLHIKPKAI